MLNNKAAFYLVYEYMLLCVTAH